MKFDPLTTSTAAFVSVKAVPASQLRRSEAVSEQKSDGRLLPESIQHRLTSELHLFEIFALRNPAVTPTVDDTSLGDTLVHSLGHLSDRFESQWQLDLPSVPVENRELLPDRFAILEADVKSRLAGAAPQFQSHLAALRRRLTAGRAALTRS